MSSSSSPQQANEAHCPLLPVVGGNLMVPLVDGSQSRYVNLDYAASAPALAAVWEHVSEVMPFYASVHRGAGYASQVSTAAYENARAIVSRFVGARADDTLVFTRNTTDSLALLRTIVPGDVVVLDIEHHANLLPWISGGAESSRVVRSEETIEATLAAVTRELASKPAALLTVTGASNVTGEVLPIRRLATIAHRHGARIAIDGAQLVPHRRVNLQTLGIDYLAFSGHKTYAPFGAGVLVGRADWFDQAPPYLRGGGAVQTVSLEETTWHSGPARHEAGSPNVIGAVALAKAVQTLAGLDEREWIAHETELRVAITNGLAEIPGVRVLSIFDGASAGSPGSPASSAGATDARAADISSGGSRIDRVGVVSFTVDGTDARALALALSERFGIGVRDGRFCAHPLLARLGITGAALRVSVGVGSSAADVEVLLNALRTIVADGSAAAGVAGAAGADAPSASRSDELPRPSWAIDEPGADGSFGCAAA